jgi:hypothetical protein
MLELVAVYSGRSGLILDHRGFEEHIQVHGYSLNRLLNTGPLQGFFWFVFPECTLEEMYMGERHNEELYVLPQCRQWGVLDSQEKPVDFCDSKYIKKSNTDGWNILSSK